LRRREKFLVIGNLSERTHDDDDDNDDLVRPCAMYPVSRERIELTARHVLSTAGTRHA